jgi:galactokinase
MSSHDKSTPRAARLAAAISEWDSDGSELRWFRAPGRVNLIGDHTDYNEGFVLPVAIDRDCVVVSRARNDGRVRIRSLDMGSDAVELSASGDEDPSQVDPEWARLAAALIRTLAETGRPPNGVDAVVASTVPLGSGLSSSAAFEVAFALALAEAGRVRLAPLELALACQRAEHVATGVPCGVMDQLAAIAGQSGMALLIDCRSLEIKTVELPKALTILAVHSGLPRRLAESSYAARRAECERVAASLGLRALRDATFDQVADHSLARHVVTENERVLLAARALETADIGAIGRLFMESHASLRDDYAVSTPELDTLVASLTEAGAVGARLTGAGFGGCVVALVESNEVDKVKSRAITTYLEATGLEPVPFLCRAVSGAGPVRPEDVQD